MHRVLKCDERFAPIPHKLSRGSPVDFHDSVEKDLKKYMRDQAILTVWCHDEYNDRMIILTPTPVKYKKIFTNLNNSTSLKKYKYHDNAKF